MNDLTLQEMLDMNKESNKKINDSKRMQENKNTNVKKVTLKDLGAGKDFGIISKHTHSDKKPLPLLILNSSAVFPRFDHKNNHIVKKEVNGKTYETVSTNNFKYGSEFALFLTFLSKINNDSMEYREDVNSITFSYNELDSMPFIKSKQNRKRFNKKEIEKVSELYNAFRLSKIDVYTYIEMLEEIKKVNDTIYRVLCEKLKTMSISSEVYDSERNLEKTIDLNFCSSYEIDNVNKKITLWIDPNFAREIRAVGIVKFPSIELMSKLSEWEMSLYMFLEDQNTGVNRNFFMSTFCEKTNLSNSNDRKTRMMINKSLKKLESLNYLTIPKKYEINKNGNTTFSFKKI